MSAATATKSEMVYEWAEKDLGDKGDGARSHRHALVMVWRSGALMPVDCLHFMPPSVL